MRNSVSPDCGGTEVCALTGPLGMSAGEELLEVLPENADPEMRWMMDYWMSKRGDRSIPLRSDIDPLDFYMFWPTIYLLEGRALEDLNVKFAGTAYRSLYGFEVTGRRIVDIIPEEMVPKVIEDYATCLGKSIPVYRESSMTWRERNAPVSYNRLLLPFGKNSQTVRYILGFAIIFTYTNKEKIVF